jgi:hypothetical protein
MFIFHRPLVAVCMALAIPAVLVLIDSLFGVSGIL